MLLIVLLHIFFCLPNTLAAAPAPTTSKTPPPSIARSSATYDWCDCSLGTSFITVWPLENKSASVQIQPSAPLWLEFNQPTRSIGWSCNGGGTNNQHSSLSVAQKIWSIQLLVQTKGVGCNAPSGRLHFANWNRTQGQSVVYSSGEHNYACIKIPVLLALHSGRLLAFAEARMVTCSDFAWTDLVVKSSDDFGKTWSKLVIVRSESNATSVPTVIGNAAPVQLTTGRILVPHTRNNTSVWTLHSDDNGVTWSTPQVIHNVTRSDWKWVGTGPPGSLQLAMRGPHSGLSGRIVVPCYHSKVRGNLINNIVHGHVMLSDDQGETWRLGQQENGFGHGNRLVNENQAVQLSNGSILINGRSFATFTKPRRLQTLSNDGGETFGDVLYVDELKQPFNGCQGSIVGSPLLNSGRLYFTGPDSVFKRDHLTLFVSPNQGASWSKQLLVDAGASGYSSLQLLGNGSVGVLYEQSDVDALIMAPDRFIYRHVPLH